MKVKRILAVAMATTMILGTSMVALADDPAPTTNIVVNDKGVYSTTTTTTTVFTAPVVKVVVPTTTPVYLNPYKISTTITHNASMDGSADVTSTNEIVAAKYLIKNESNLPVKIVPTITTTAKGAVLQDQSKVSATDAAALTTKWVRLSTEIKAKTEGGLIGSAMEYDLGHKYTGKQGDEYPYVVLKAATFTGTPGTEEYAVSSAVEATLEFTGDLNDPDNVATAWSDKTDSLTIVVKYDIYPMVNGYTGN